MKLLLDENLSPRLSAALFPLYPGTVHLRDCGLRGASDVEVWKYARENGFAIVSKDSDFRQRSTLLGFPPKVISLRIGNCTTSRAEFLLSNVFSQIHAFLRTSQEGCLVLKHPRWQFLKHFLCSFFMLQILCKHGQQRGFVKDGNAKFPSLGQLAPRVVANHDVIRLFADGA